MFQLLFSWFDSLKILFYYDVGFEKSDCGLGTLFWSLYDGIIVGCMFKVLSVIVSKLPLWPSDTGLNFASTSWISYSTPKSDYSSFYRLISTVLSCSFSSSLTSIPDYLEPDSDDPLSSQLELSLVSTSMTFLCECRTSNLTFESMSLFFRKTLMFLIFLTIFTMSNSFSIRSLPSW